jgi:hypothetical protein
MPGMNGADVARAARLPTSICRSSSSPDMR